MLEFIYGLFDSYYYSNLHHAVIIVSCLDRADGGGGCARCHDCDQRRALPISLGTRLFLGDDLQPISSPFGCSRGASTPFFSALSFITLYGALTGYRAPQRKEGQARWFDSGNLTWLALTTGIGLILWGVLTGLGCTDTIYAKWRRAQHHLMSFCRSSLASASSTTPGRTYESTAPPRWIAAGGGIITWSACSVPILG